MSANLRAKLEPLHVSLKEYLVGVESGLDFLIAKEVWRDHDDEWEEMGTQCRTVLNIVEFCVCSGGDLTAGFACLRKLATYRSKYGRIQPEHDLGSLDVFHLRILLMYYDTSLIDNYMWTSQVPVQLLDVHERVFMEYCRQEGIDLASITMYSSSMSNDSILLYWVCRLFLRKNIVLSSYNLEKTEGSSLRKTAVVEAMRVCRLLNEWLSSDHDVSLAKEIEHHLRHSLLIWFKGLKRRENQISLFTIFMLFVVVKFHLEGSLPQAEQVLLSMTLPAVIEALEREGKVARKA